MQNDIRTALESLDKTNDEHWTSDGLPRVDVVVGLVGKDVSRADVNAVAPSFTRTDPNLPQLPTGGENGNPGSIDGQGDETVSDKDAALKEMEEAEADMSKARARHDAAYKALTEINVAEAASQSSQAANVKAFQESQRKQREQEAERKASLDSFLKGAQA